MNRANDNHNESLGWLVIIPLFLAFAAAAAIVWGIYQIAHMLAVAAVHVALVSQ